MKNTKVVNLVQIRHLLAELDVIRADVIKGNVQAWVGLMRDSEGRDKAYVGGAFIDNSREAAKALMKIAAARALLADEREDVAERPRLSMV